MKIQAFGKGQTQNVYVTANSLVNMYCEARPGGEKSSMVGLPTPGLRQYVNIPSTTPVRGAWEMLKNGFGYCVIGNVFYEINGTAVTSRGALATSTGRVSICDNGTQVMIVDGTEGYIFDTVSLVFSTITDADFPNSPETVTFLQGRFVCSFAESNRFYWSAVYDGLSWTATDYASAEASPDPIILVWSNSGQLVLFGSRTTEFWAPTGVVSSPFTPVSGASNEWGIVTAWSVSKYDNTCAGLFRNRMGQVMVGTLSGYLPKKISNPDLDKIINNYGDLECSGYSYMLGGHPMYVLNFTEASWLYDGSTGIWSILKSYGLNRHLGEIGLTIQDKTIVSSYVDGVLYELTSNVRTDDGDPIERHIITQTLASPDGERITIDKFRADVEVGQASASTVSPQIGLRVSRDNGNTWGAELMRDLGPIGFYNGMPEWTRLGSARTFVFDLRVSDDVDFVFVRGIVNPSD